MYAVQEGIRLSKNDKEAKVYLLGIMDEIESVSVSLVVQVMSVVIFVHVTACR